MPRVCVITRTRNRPVLLRRALQSVQRQTFTDLAQVVVNDGGATGSVDELVSGLRDPRVRVLHRDESFGMEAASNAGLRECDSEFCVIHDDDDSWEPGFLAETIAFLEADARFGGVVTHSTAVYERIEGLEVTELRREAFNPGLFAIDAVQLATSNRFPPISFLYRRSVLDRIGPYDERMPVLGDWEFNLRFVRHAEIGVIARPLANYHHRPNQRSVYGNSLFAASHQHHLYRAYLANKLIRENTASSVALASFVSVGEHGERLLSTLERLASVLASLERARQSATSVVDRLKGLVGRAGPE